jgi:hypothetical protein
MKVSFAVSFELPPDATIKQAREYVDEAVSCWHGSLEPKGADLGDGTFTEGHPMSALKDKTVKVAEITPSWVIQWLHQ